MNIFRWFKEFFNEKEIYFGVKILDDNSVMIGEHIIDEQDAHKLYLYLAKYFSERRVL